MTEPGDRLAEATPDPELEVRSGVVEDLNVIEDLNVTGDDVVGGAKLGPTPVPIPYPT